MENVFEGMSQASIDHSEDSYIKAELVGLEKKAIEAITNGNDKTLDEISGHSDAGTALVEQVKEVAKMEEDLRELIG